MVQPIVSVIIPAYNCEKYICQAVDSVFRQQVFLELLVIDDCSTDRTEEVLKPYKNRENFYYIRNERNLGAASSRNKGIQMARGKYVAFLDADDWWDPNKLKEQLELLKVSGAVLCSTGRELMRADGTRTGKIIPVKPVITYKALLKHNAINCSSVVLEKEVALAYPMCHDEIHEDYITWLRILQKYGQAVAVNKPYLKCRLSEGGKSRNKWKSAKMTFQVYRYMGYNFPRSCMFFISYAIHGIRKYW